MTTRAWSFAAGIVAVGAVGALVLNGPEGMPDPRLTPGAIASTDTAEICTPGYARAHRMAFGAPGEYERYRAVMEAYGIPRDLWHLYELDDRVPIELGGANLPSNLWPQIFDDARRKDRLENAEHHAVCAGRVSLADAQALFLGDWRDSEK
jgi:hypothetical protein